MIRQRGAQMSTLSTLISTLKSSGLAQAAIPGIIQQIAGNSPNGVINAACQVILANSSNQAVIQDEAKKIAETPNCPPAVLALLPEFANATTPFQVVQLVQAIETSIGGSAIGGGLSLGNL